MSQNVVTEILHSQAESQPSAPIQGESPAASDAPKQSSESPTSLVSGQHTIPQPDQKTSEAYENVDKEQKLEQALEEKKEVEQLSEKIEELDKSQEESPSSESDEFSSKFAALSRKEKAIREKESQLNAKLAEIEEKLAKLEPTQEQKPSEPELPLEYRLKKDPLGTLAELGLSFDNLTNLALNDGKLTPEMQMELLRQEIDQKYSKELDQLKNELLERDKRIEEEKYNEAINGFKTELASFINGNESYELIRANNAVDVVYDVIEQHFHETKNIMSKEEAANLVEKYFEDEVEKHLKLSKVKSKLEASTAPQKAPNEPKSAPQAPTLSNAHSATASKPSRQLTRDESVAAAASLLKWNN